MNNIQAPYVMQNLNLHVLWLKDSLGFCVNYKTPKGFIPLTRYYFWPISEAWDQLKVELESKLWLPSEERIKILNLVVETMTDWQQSRNSSNKNPLTKEKTPLLKNVTINGFS